MPIDSVPELVRILSKYPLLESAQRDELEGILKAQYTDPRTLSKELLLRGWLTPFQVNQLFQDRGPELMLGSYVIIERLTEGAVGQLFRARHQHMKRTVALQVVRPELLRNPEAVAQFYQEIQAVSQLSSQHLVAAYDAGPIGNTHFFAMEYVDGIDLERLVHQSGPLPVEQACEFIRQAALGLQHAAERGLLHHDLRPANLLLARMGGSGHGNSEGSSRKTRGDAGSGPLVKIRNLGLTLIRQHTKHTRLLATPSGEPDAAAAVDFLAPERATGTGDVRSELYSLGGSFYFLLTGQVPFPGGSREDKLRRHQEEEPVPVELLRPEVPVEVASMVRVLMAKQPAERFQQPAEVAAVLTTAPEPGADAAPAAAMSAWQQRRTAEQKRWRRWVFAGAGVLVAGIIFLGAFLIGPLSTAPEPTKVVEGEKPLLVTVDARGTWQDAHVDVTAAQPVVLRARGRWKRGPKGYESGPEGSAVDARDRCVLQDTPAMALIGMVGNDAPVAIGAGKTLVPGTSGRLFVQANDLDPRENSGTLTLDIQGGKANAEDVPVWQFGHGELDEGARKVKSFNPLPFWPVLGAWAPKPTLPVDKLGHLHWNPTSSGGHPGSNRTYSLIRRWVVPRDGAMALSGTLVHPAGGGDGVRGWLMVNSQTVRGGPWIVHNNKLETKVPRLEVKRGDVVHAVLDPRGSSDSDSFTWNPALQVLEWK